MPHPCPSLHIATTEVAASEGVLSGLLARISRGAAFAMGEPPAPKPTPNAPKRDPCAPQMAALHECLSKEAPDCSDIFDDLIRCRYAFLPSGKPVRTQFFTR